MRGCSNLVVLVVDVQFSQHHLLKWLSFLLYIVLPPWSELKWKLLSHVWLFVTSWTRAYRLLCPWSSPGQNTGMVCHFLLHRIFPTQGLNPGLLPCRQILHCMSHQGSRCSCPVFPAPSIVETVFSPLYILASLIADYLTVSVWVYIWTLYSVSLICVSIFVLLPYCFDYCS